MTCCFIDSRLTRRRSTVDCLRFTPGHFGRTTFTLYSAVIAKPGSRPGSRFSMSPRLVRKGRLRNAGMFARGGLTARREERPLNVAPASRRTIPPEGSCYEAFLALFAHCCARHLLLQRGGHGGEPDPRQRKAMDGKSGTAHRPGSGARWFQDPRGWR
jgi:hypothetical protein